MNIMPRQKLHWKHKDILISLQLDINKMSVIWMLKAFRLTSLNFSHKKRITTRSSTRDNFPGRFVVSLNLMHF